MQKERTSYRVESVAEPPSHAIGQQVILDLYECAPARLDDLPWVQSTLVNAARAAGATIVEVVFHKFAPWGISGVVVLAESHLAILIWPENRYVAIDAFTCGDAVRPELASAFLARAFGAKYSVQRRFVRGGAIPAEDGSVSGSPKTERHVAIPALR